LVFKNSSRPGLEKAGVKKSTLMIIVFHSRALWLQQVAVLWQSGA
jgi:hypothetical protein